MSVSKKNSSFSPDWICCQIGAREHYSVARALHRRGRLAMLITDAWVPLGHPLRLLSPKLAERNSVELLDANACASNVSSVSREIINRLLKPGLFSPQWRRGSWRMRPALEDIQPSLAKWPGRTLQRAPHAIGLPIVDRFRRATMWSAPAPPSVPAEFEARFATRQLGEQNT